MAVISDPLKGELLMLAMSILKFDTVGMLLMVRNCCPNELDKLQSTEILPTEHSGEFANKLLKVVC